MSRLKRFVNSLVSGYVQLGAQSLFTLASLPMALHYLPTRAEFGLWGVTTQMASYIALLDFGLAGAAARLLVDYKDHEDRAEYGGMVVTGALVGVSQAALVLALGVFAAYAAGPLLQVPAESRDKLFWLVVGQSVITAAMFATRIIVHVLTSHQRYYISNLSSALSLAVNLGMMWYGFSAGMGVYAMLLGQACGVASSIAVDFVCCLRLRLLPGRDEWGRPTWEKFRHLFSYGSDLFVMMLGNQLINASQTILVTRVIGLDAAALWTGCTRAFLVVVQIIGRVFDYSTAALAEMMVRGERENLKRRFRDIVTLTMNMSVAAAAIYAVCNGPFVQTWTSGKFVWPARNDFLVGAWLIVNIAVRVHSGLVGQTKEFGFMRFVFFLEGIVFVGLTLFLHRFGGITMMLVLSLVCSLCFSCPYCLWRTCRYFQMSWRDLAQWHRASLLMAANVAPMALALWLTTGGLPAAPRLAVEAAVIGPWTLWRFLHLGLGDSLKADLSRMAPNWLRALLFSGG
jgi:O-antigen/teichoic acid export membrane protein